MITRLLDMLVVLLGVVSLVFLLGAVIPGDPVDVMLGEHASSADREALRASLGLDRPLLVRWGSYLAGLAQGDLGRSLVRDRPVAELIGERLPATLSMARWIAPRHCSRCSASPFPISGSAPCWCCCSRSASAGCR